MGMLGFPTIHGLLAALAATMLWAAAAAAFFEPFNVSYDHRAIIIGGERRMLISSGIHYPRATPDMWPGLIAKSKEGGADVIQTYVFWNGHEPIRGQYNFEGRYDLVKFAKLIGSQGLYLHLRIGPYVCAEWNFGGLPVWLRDIPGIVFRTKNKLFQDEMERFVKLIVDLMKQEMLFSWQGGPIILVQVENEYGNIEAQYGQGGKEYVKWAAEMALSLGAGVPWVMCKQSDAPETIIDSCNAFYCDGFRPNSYKKPALWTEDWNGWFASWGGRVPHRPVEDNAFAVARFFQRGGSFHNYYMFFGGTNFDRTAGGPLQATSYDYDAPIDEYGLLTQPKWGHLKDLHAAIKLCEPALVAVDDSPQYVKLGPMQEAHIYSSGFVDTSKSLPGNVSICSAFLANIDEHKTVSVRIFGGTYSLPPWSVSILPYCKHVVFNTAKVTAQVSIKTVEYSSPSSSSTTGSGNIILYNEDNQFSNKWMTFQEPLGTWGDNSFMSPGILEHLNVTKDISDYLWYSTRVNISDEDIAFWEEKGVLPVLTINKTRDVVRIFVNGHLSASQIGQWVPVEQPINLVRGSNDLVLLSETVGLQNYGAFLEKDGAGFRGQIKISGLRNGDIDLSNFWWTYQVGLKGEHAKLYIPDNQESADWIDLQLDSIPSPFTWYKTTFDAPEGDDPVALDLGSMGKGQVWVNGQGIGRYWTLVAPKSGCAKSCNYPGAYNENKCATNCGNPTQSWYHIPREWLQASNNLLVIFEETGGNPLLISLKVHSTETICAKVSETDYPPLSTWTHPKFVNNKNLIDSAAPEMQLRCDEGHIISDITFASYGTPTGSCQTFSLGTCHAPSSLSVVTEACQGRNNCTISVSNLTFGDPCRGVVKALVVEAKCASITGDTKMLSTSQKQWNPATGSI
ncbi:beta-galactosidase 15 isoform X1 [Canna indica]|uniref:Beta-galactosidase n=1 Tax=Canna indica TaxID=4628 RepID=A0AAQ3K0X1_9LILI|nr:beta-galactosidase 15 isoform X1 [Canna indica]